MRLRGWLESLALKDPMHHGVSNDSTPTHTLYELGLDLVVGPAASMVDRCMAFRVE